VLCVGCKLWFPLKLPPFLLRCLQIGLPERSVELLLQKATCKPLPERSGEKESNPTIKC
jgi:hypothetical protein